jgi:hypothetical protein
MGVLMPNYRLVRRYICVEFKLEGEDDPSFPNVIGMREQVDQRGIGFTDGSGSDSESADFSFLVKDELALESALADLKALLKEYHAIPEKTIITVYRIQDPVCAETPIFDVCACLSFRFDDGDYGGIVVLGQHENSDYLYYRYGKGTLIRVLDYKQPDPPAQEDFEKQQWLLSTQEHFVGQIMLLELICYEEIDLKTIGVLASPPVSDWNPQRKIFWDELAHYAMHREVKPRDEPEDDDDEGIRILW